MRAPSLPAARRPPPASELRPPHRASAVKCLECKGDLRDGLACSATGELHVSDATHVITAMCVVCNKSAELPGKPNPDGKTLSMSFGRHLHPTCSAARTSPGGINVSPSQLEKLRKKGLAYEKTKKGNTWRITEVNEIECKECDE